MTARMTDWSRPFLANGYRLGAVPEFLYADASITSDQMALVKKSTLAATKISGETASATSRTSRNPTPPLTSGRRGKVTERLAAATEQLAGGIQEAAAAAEELRRTMDQIASGAAEAAGASQQQLAAIKRVSDGLAQARSLAESTRRRIEVAEVSLAETAGQITSSARAIEQNGRRQSEVIERVAELERRALDIEAITRTVSRISDQTNLLALNAAIEAARAGDRGRGFAVVADEVRSLAESSEKNAQEIQSLTNAIRGDVRDVVTALKQAGERAVEEAKAGAIVVARLDELREALRAVSIGSEEILNGALEAERAAGEAQRGAAIVASAAEEQSSASTESQTAISEQAKALDQGQQAARALAAIAEKTRTGHSDSMAAEKISSTAEELSATVQEISGAAQQIMTAVSQIHRGIQQQASATQQTSAALAQIENGARVAQQNVTNANDRIASVDSGLRESAGAIEKLVMGVETGLEATRTSQGRIVALEQVGRRIDKLVGGISMVVVQTSMLAVSGAVEAARAGDSGRGFATVSADIRALAREASDSVENIRETVGRVLDQISTVRRDLDQIVATAEIEVQTNRAIAGTLAKVGREAGALASTNRDILQGADAILLAAVETAAGARQIASAAHEAGTAAREASTASSEQARGAEDLAAAIEEIAALAGEFARERT